jgi:threonine dehydrogenase-like Zn-dependent dehydrogenase
MGATPVDTKVEYKGRGDGSTMKALAWFGPRDVRIIDAPVPDITDPDDVIVKVTGTTVCGSDLHLYHGEIAPLEKGDILGHEVYPSVYRSSTNAYNCQVYGHRRSRRTQCYYRANRAARRCFIHDCVWPVLVLCTEAVVIL